jgi:hypothetical protein
MNIEFITQKKPEHISAGDIICLFNDERDGTPSGKYTVAGATDDGDVTLIGMGHLEGTITVICLGGNHG